MKPVVRAVLLRDLPALVRLQSAAKGGYVQQLATAARQAMLRRDDRALAGLSRLAGPEIPADIRGAALIMRSDVYLRLGRYADCYADLLAVRRLRSLPFTPGMTQTMQIANALSGTPPIRLEKSASWFTYLVRDKLGLEWTKIWLNGRAAGAVMDSGTGFSVITESEAKRVGLNVLPGGIQVSSDAKARVSCRLGVMDNLSFGKVVLRHVPFLVMPDSAMTFVGRYNVPVIIGSAVFMQFGEIAFLHQDKTELLYYGDPWEDVSAGPNLVVNGVKPYALLPVGKEKKKLRLFLDSGSASSHISAAALEMLPSQQSYATPAALRWGGAGGEQLDLQGARLSQLMVRVSGRDFQVDNVAVRSRAVSGQDGVLGQDLLRQGWGFVMNFRDMRFSIVPKNAMALRRLHAFQQFSVTMKNSVLYGNTDSQISSGDGAYGSVADTLSATSGKSGTSKGH